MTEQELQDTGRFKNLPLVDEADEQACWKLERPYEPDQFDGAIREALDAEEFSTLAGDPDYVLKGAVRDDGGNVRAICWHKLRK